MATIRGAPLSALLHIQHSQKSGGHKRSGSPHFSLKALTLSSRKQGLSPPFTASRLGLPAFESTSELANELKDTGGTCLGSEKRGVLCLLHILRFILVYQTYTFQRWQAIFQQWSVSLTNLYVFLVAQDPELEKQVRAGVGIHAFHQMFFIPTPPRPWGWPSDLAQPTKWQL